MARRPAADPATRHPSELLALAIGAVYALVGILGFLITGFEDFAAETDKALLGFEVNPLHNLVHLVIGLAGLALSRRLDTAKTYGWLLAAGYGRPWRPTRANVRLEACAAAMERPPAPLRTPRDARYGRPASARLGPAPWSVQASIHRADGRRTLLRSTPGGDPT